jgi:hypothetical protein
MACLSAVSCWLRAWPGTADGGLHPTSGTLKRHAWHCPIQLPLRVDLGPKPHPPFWHASNSGCRYIAAWAGHTHVVGVLLASGACPDTPNEGDLATALHAAASKGHAHIVQLLLEGGASHGVRDCTGATPLDVAAAEGHGGVVAALTAAAAGPGADSVPKQDVELLVDELARWSSGQLLVSPAPCLRHGTPGPPSLPPCLPPALITEPWHC